MKVIGLSNDGYSPKYIVEVSHDEINTAFEKGYHQPLAKLKVGDELNLADIPRQRERIVEATQKMQSAYETFIKAAPVMADVARVIGAAPRQEVAP